MSFISVLATGPKGRGLKSVEAMDFSFGWDVKPEAPRRNILPHVKYPLTLLDTDTQNSHSFVHSSYSLQMSLLVGLPESSSGRVRSFLQAES
jgi:hypothetical protein